jgi:hypothetical protein
MKILLFDLILIWMSYEVAVPVGQSPSRKVGKAGITAIPFFADRP